MEYVRGYYDDETTNTLFITNFKTLTYASFKLVGTLGSLKRFRNEI